MLDRDAEVEPQDECSDVEELRAVLKIKEALILSLTSERDDMERRLKELGQKYMEMIGVYETLRSEMERLPSLEEVVRMQSVIALLEQQLKTLKSVR